MGSLVSHILRDDAVHAQFEKSLYGEDASKSKIETLFHLGEIFGDEEGCDDATRSLNDAGRGSVGDRFVEAYLVADVSQ